jgi:hypothetical protein
VKLQPPRLRLLGRVDGLSIYLVDGERVRNEIDVDFVNGGNGAIYPSYIPLDEIWIDDAQHALDRTATALHELIERDLMLHHGRNYDSAHDLANVYERAFRWELKHHRPTGYAARRVVGAYHSYLRGRQGHKTARQLDREITGALHGRTRTSSRSR